MIMKYFFGILLFFVSTNAMATNNHPPKPEKHLYTREAYAKYTKYQCRSFNRYFDGQFIYYSMFKIRYGTHITIIGMTASGTLLSKERIRKIESFECKEYLEDQKRYTSDTKKCKALKKIVDKINFAYDQEEPSLITMTPDELVRIVTADTGDRER